MSAHLAPRIETHGRFGISWVDATGSPVRLVALVEAADQPKELLAAHAQALDAVLKSIGAAYGAVINEVTVPTNDDRAALSEAGAEIDRAVIEYAEAYVRAGRPTNLRESKIIGSAGLLGIGARAAAGEAMTPPLTEGLAYVADPVRVSLAWAVPAEPWRGARWVGTTADGVRTAATLRMAREDPVAGVAGEADEEHVEALQLVMEVSAEPDADPGIVAGAIDWLLYDWLMSNRELTDTGAVGVPGSTPEHAALVIDATAYAARLRARARAGVS